ncbi:hypothetical protein NST38_30885 [Paenibacillus sp. FSL H8-0104]|uniref:hypothetical protein n=1 Tax=Paenibacillus sp. FSL H8-0104 TaxID=2954509 RepID=UPI0030FD2AC4
MLMRKPLTKPFPLMVHKSKLYRKRTDQTVLGSLGHALKQQVIGVRLEKTFRGGT